MEQSNPALEQFLRSIPLFSLVEAPEMMDVLRLIRPVTLEPGEVLFRQGEAGDAMWILGNGAEVSVSATLEAGKRPVVVAYAKAGDTVGEMALVDDGARSGTAVVMQGGPAHHVSAIDFHILRSTWKPAAFKILRRICVDLCAKLRATSDRIAPSDGAMVDPSPSLGNAKPASAEEIEAFEPFRALPSVVKLALTQKLSVVETDGITPLFAEGEVADAAYFIVNGEVTVGRAGRTLATMGPGQMFGLVAAIDGGLRSASCVTAGPARLLRLSDADFDALFANGNKIAFRIVDLVARQLVAHLREADSKLPQPGHNSQEAQAPAQHVAPMTPEAVAAASHELFDDSSLDEAAIEISGEHEIPLDLDAEDEILPEAEVLPLDLELSLDILSDEPL